MKSHEAQESERGRELGKRSLELAALVALSGLAYRLVMKDSRLRNHGIERGDIINTAAIKVLSTTSQFRGESQQSTWSYRIVVNAAKDLAEKIGNRRELQSDPEPAILNEEDLSLGPEQSIMLREERERLATAMAELSEVERVVIFKHHVEGCSLKEIAKELGMPLGTIKSHNFRGKEKLREILSRETDG